MGIEVGMAQETVIGQPLHPDKSFKKVKEISVIDEIR